MSGFDPVVVSNNLLQRAFRDSVPVSPMKLQKILFFAASEYAKRASAPLLSGKFEPWRYGPVNREVYREFKPFGGSEIRGYALDAARNAFVVDESQYPVLGDILDRVWSQTKGLSAVTLSRLTHEVGSAWYKAYTQDKSVIDDEDLRADFTYQAKLGLG